MAVLTEEQSMLRDQARAWLRQKAPVAALRRLRDSAAPLAYDPALWREMADMGWAGVLVPEAYGGSDFGYLSLGLILEETGRTLAASPLLASALAAASAVVLGATEAQKQAILPKLATGELVATLAVDEGPRHAPERIGARAVETDGGYLLSGTKTFVLEGLAAHLLVVAARTSGEPGDAAGVTLFLVPADAPGVTRRALRLADSRGAAEVTFADTPVGQGSVLGEAGAGAPLLEAVLDRARAGLAAEMLGTALQAFEITVDYLKTRVQFGQLIGGFQALQHRAAKMYGELELSRSCVEAALAAIDQGAADIPELCSLAKAHVGETLFLVSNELIQMHGGIGMTDAHDAGLYLKRARVAEAAFGGRAYHRERFAGLNDY
jgi:alkylation response protein AidB-like acyl-CoA dehydrogenase